ncbi:hypothetical protein JRG19_10115 [Pseudoclavibacter alba]|uniref:hypothetical protein n=1 Tax=Pseudoclavibacter albus TaxID=272241 RepID=UPI0019D28339|nr:hypothetical protein [Pseudoclavibacter alba]MBN6778884.1 hypothetical protein [Pseudoclavibacter alba]
MSADRETFLPEELEEDVPLRVTLSDIPRGVIKSQQTAVDEQTEAEKRDKQNTDWRSPLFWGVYGLVGAIAAVEIIVIFIYLGVTGSNVDATALGVWFTATAAEIIGLAAIITRHLFPTSSSTSDDEK